METKIENSEETIDWEGKANNILAILDKKIKEANMDIRE